MKNSRTLGQKIGSGFVLIILILAVTVGVTIFQLKKSMTVSHRISILRGPTAQASLMMLNGVNHSLAALRGWIIIGEDKFKQERAFAWSEEIEKSMEALSSLSQEWTNPENLKRLDKARKKLSEFKRYQQEIEDIAHAKDNLPAAEDWKRVNFLLKTKAAPVGFEIKDILRVMVDNQKNLMEEDFSANEEMLNRLFVIEWVLLGIGILLGFGVSRSIIRSATGPIRNAMETADKIAGGDVESTITITGFQEIELLGDSLARMQTQIRERSETVKESELKNRIIVETSADGIITITEKGMVLTVNQAGCDMFGYLKEEIVGKNIKMLMPDPYRREHDGYLNNYKNTGTAKIIGLGREVAGMRKDKTTFPIYLTVAEVKLKNEKLFAGVIRDITVSKELEKDLRKSGGEKEEQLWMINAKNTLGDKIRGSSDIAELSRNIVHALADLTKTDIGAVYVAQEDRSLKLLGSYAFKDRQNNFNEFQPGEGLVGQAALEKTSILFSEIPEDSAKINYGIGEVLPHHFLISPVVYEGEVKAVIALGAVREFSPQHRAFLDQASMDIGIAFNLVQSQEQIQNLLTETQKQSAVLRESEEKLRVQQEELQNTNQELEKKTKTLKTQASALEQSNVELEEKSKSLEQQKDEIDSQNIEIQTKAQEIEQKAIAVEEASRYKSEFLANMSHELRTPLNSLLILSKMFVDNEEKRLDEDQVESAKVIHGCGTELLGLINDILDLSKVEAGKIEVHPETFRADELKSYIENTFAPVAGKKGTELTVRIDKNITAGIRTDKQRLEQIIKNLLSNALKFTDKGSVKVNIFKPKEIPVGIDLDKSKAVAVAVIDSGIGIAQDKHRLVFEAFKQADGSTNRKFGGTGLGLSISKRFANLLGGDILLESEPGKGSTFTLLFSNELDVSGSVQETKQEGPGDVENRQKLIVKPDPSAKQSDMSRDHLDDDRDGITANDKSILIVEDDLKFAKILTDVTRKKGFKTLHASDGRAALDVVNTYNPSAIILDIMLPTMDGWSVMQRLKDNPDTRHIPVHFSSCLEENLEAFKQGAIGYMSKPVTQESLNEALGKIERFINSKVKRLLIAGSDRELRNSVVTLIKTKNIDIVESTEYTKALDELQQDTFDSLIVIYDNGADGFSDFLEELSKLELNERLPVIVCPAQPLTDADKDKLGQLAQNSVVVSAKSMDMLLDETLLFLHQVENDLSDDQKQKIKMLHDTQSIIKDKKILIVDDDMRNVFSLSKVLKMRGLKICRAENGKVALETLEKEPDIDLVLMDIMMPVMDGYEAIKEIRKLEKFKELPVIALTAKAMTGDREKCIQVGASDYLAKPVDIERLVSMLRVWLYK